MRFLVETRFSQAPTNEMLALIPAESARGKQLDEQGIREHLYLSADLSRAWQIYRGESVAAVQTILDTFPLAPFVNTTIIPLADDAPG